MGDGKKAFSSVASYPLLEEPHHSVHEKVRTSLACIAQGNCVEKTENILENFRVIELKSKELFTILDQMVIEAKRV
ncbi:MULTISPECIES: hypothetical protein [unclassified Sulfurospirillum]|uniref:hypothetical protein n=1 Tax=unclassified Sulfurospirillum TaxID=2618290 RepID=UPI00050216D8|nr:MULTISPECIES: hypothetical protein [unclassified Sulfurospirillum]KFL34310.1 hypothetical protein JU57_05965 [Sulfurospirillum sp. SCADC]